MGANLAAPGVSSLRTLVNLLEPVKHYERGGLQVWSNQLIPLVGLADAARPDSAASREFAVSVDQAQFAPGSIDRDMARSFEGTLKAWAEAASTVQGAMSETYPAVREAIVPARALIEACSVANEVSASLASGTPITEAALASDLAKLDHAGQPNASATELPILKPIRLLAVAAAKQGGRPGLGDPEWRTLVESTAFPKPPAAAAK